MKSHICRLLLTGVAVAALATNAAPGDTKRFALPGWVELELVEVGGTSRLPLQYLYTKKNKENLSLVNAPTYWIGKFEVMQKQYEAVMGTNPSSLKDERMPVNCVRWQDAVDFCDRLNHAFKGELPKGYRFDLPTVVEWAHAFTGAKTNALIYAGSDDLDSVAWHGVEGEGGIVKFDSMHLVGLKRPNAIKAYDMSGNLSEYVFVADAKGGHLHMGGSYRLPEKFCEVTGTALMGKDAISPDVGFRVALVPIKAVDPDGKTKSMGTKGRILLRSGCATLARKYLAEAMNFDDLSLQEAQRLRQSWIDADLACGYDIGSWEGLLMKLGLRMKEFGYSYEDIFRFWSLDRYTEEWTDLRQTIRKLYSNNKIYGMTCDIRDLPPDVVKHLGPTLSKKVQAVSCDFTGDGRRDLIVELAGCSNENGELYGFFEMLPSKGYRLIGEPIRTVGMCILPDEGRGVQFLVLVKMSSEVVAAGVMDCTMVNKKPCLRVAWPLDRSYCLGELVNERVHRKVPFMGKRNAARVRHIAEGNYVRPICWPWR